MAPPFLPVIRIITLPDGTQLTPAEELRISTGLDANVIVGDGPTRIELTATEIEAVPTFLLVPQAAVLAAGPATVLFVIVAARHASVEVTAVQFIPHANTALDVVNYAEFNLAVYDEDGVFVQYLLDGDIGTGDIAFTSMQTDISLVVSHTLKEGRTIVAEWSKGGAGADVPGGTWIIT